MQNDPFNAGETRSQMQDGVKAVKEAASQATEFVRRQADRRSRELGGRLSAAADDLETTASQGQDIAASAARQLAQVARSVGYYLETTDTKRMLEDARRFTREQPWTVVAIGMVAGFALSRVVKHALPSSE
jgi:ElaB/YqjD/DUF883 family membrane-anchored ribosome-binding protein